MSFYRKLLGATGALICAFIPLQAVDFVLFTEPKTGTHLLFPILTELTGKTVYWPRQYVANSLRTQRGVARHKANTFDLLVSTEPLYWKREVMDFIWDTAQTSTTYLHMHPPYSSAMENYLRSKKTISFFVERDPRDRIVSLLNHNKNIQLLDPNIMQFDTDQKKLLYMAKGKIRKQMLSFLGWRKSPLCCVLDFNKLMGAHGGTCTNQDALGEMRKIAAALEIEPSNEYLMEVYCKCFGHGRAFFKGKVCPSGKPA